MLANCWRCKTLRTPPSVARTCRPWRGRRRWLGARRRPKRRHWTSRWRPVSNCWPGVASRPSGRCPAVLEQERGHLPGWRFRRRREAAGRVDDRVVREEDGGVGPCRGAAPPRMGWPDRKHEHCGGPVLEALAQRGGGVRKWGCAVIRLAPPRGRVRVDSLRSWTSHRGIEARQVGVEGCGEMVDRHWTAGVVQGIPSRACQAPTRAVPLPRQAIGPHVLDGGEPGRLYAQVPIGENLAQLRHVSVQRR